MSLQLKGLVVCALTHKAGAGIGGLAGGKKGALIVPWLDPMPGTGEPF